MAWCDRNSFILPYHRATVRAKAERIHDVGPECRVQCLKYLVLASMLMESHVDPFNAQETKPYKADPQILAMTDLVGAYQESDINKFERVLRASKATVYEDPFIRPYVEDLINVLRTQVGPCMLSCNGAQAVSVSVGPEARCDELCC